MFKIDDDTYIAKEDISAIQNEEIWGDSGSISSASPYLKFKGSRIILKNGRKIFVKGKNPAQIIKELNPSNHT